MATVPGELTRRVLVVPPGQSSQFEPLAKKHNCPVIKERRGQFQPFVILEPVPSNLRDPMSDYWRMRWATAVTIPDKLQVLAERLGLENLV